MELKGRTALITGSAKGLGRSTALQLAGLGCNIILNYVNSQQEAECLQEKISRMGVFASAVRADVSDPVQVAKLAAQAEQLSGGGIDILINNAGPFIRERRLFTDYRQEEIISLLHGNLLGVMMLDHHVLPGMRERNWGRIIHFGFGHAGEARAWPHRAVYAAAKTGLVSFTKTLAVEEATHGVTVNMICPGDIKGVNKEKTIEEVQHEIDEESPRGRPGTGEDVARAIAFLCSAKSDFITGNILDITGGLDPIRSRLRN
ncbi:SDR family oxidoreductase [Paenibacillaceae bacterium]|nr:SDR family oxidoreductase [Paenibacillaceae bacterium]